MLKDRETQECERVYSSIVDYEISRALAIYTSYPEHLREAAFKTMSRYEETYVELEFNPTVPYSLVQKYAKEADSVYERGFMLERAFTAQELETLTSMRLSATETAGYIAANLLTRKQVESTLDRMKGKQPVAKALLAQKHLTCKERRELLERVSRSDKWVQLAFNPYLTVQDARKLVKKETTQNSAIPDLLIEFVIIVFTRFPEVVTENFDSWVANLTRPKTRQLLNIALANAQHLEQKHLELLGDNLAELNNANFLKMMRNIKKNPHLTEQMRETFLKRVRNRKTAVIWGDTYPAYVEPVKAEKPLKEYVPQILRSGNPEHYPLGWVVELFRGRAEELLHNPVMQDFHTELLRLYPFNAEDQLLLYWSFLGGKNGVKKGLEATNLSNGALEQNETYVSLVVQSILRFVQNPSWSKEEQQTMFVTFLNLLPGREDTVEALLKASAKLNSLQVT